MRNIYKSEIFEKAMSLSDKELASIDCKAIAIMQEVKNGIATKEPRLIMTSTDGKLTVVDGYDNVEKACKKWIAIIDEKKVPFFERVCKLIETYLAGVKVTFLGNERYCIRKLSNDEFISVNIPEKNVDTLSQNGLSDSLIARQLIDSIKSEFDRQRLTKSDGHRFCFNGVFWFTEKKKGGPLEIMTADEVMVMLENSKPGQLRSDGTFDDRPDVRTWTAEDSYEDVMESRKMVENLIDPEKPIIKTPTIMCGMEFEDVSDEVYRTYEFPDGKVVKIYKPVKLNVSKSGGHRVLDEKGVSHYIPTGWVHLSWKVKDGKSPFSF
jgi:hypothetical protein